MPYLAGPATSGREGAHLSRGDRTREEILERAVDLSSLEGLEGLTIGRLARDLNLSKSGLFAHFGSKEELQLAAVDAAASIFIQQVVRPTLDAGRGLARLAALLERWLSYVERSVFSGGCFFWAASAEFDGRPGPVRDRVAALAKSWLAALESETREAQARGELRPAADVAQLAFECHAFVQEANWAYQLFRQKPAFGRARAALRERLERAATARGLKQLQEAPAVRRQQKKNRNTYSRRSRAS